MSSRIPKVVTTVHYHVWTDALHARALARQAHNRWDRGAYVRWTVNTAWTAFEIACEDALQTSDLGNRFRNRLDEAIAARRLPEIDWGKGIWQRVLLAYGKRKAYTHHSIAQVNLFADIGAADETIATLREAIIAVFAHAGKAPPTWVNDDEDRGWDDGRDGGLFGTVIHPGAREDDPDVIRIAFVVKDREHVHRLLPPGTDPAPYFDELLRGTLVPISALRLYCGNTLVDEQVLPMRGT